MKFPFLAILSLAAPLLCEAQTVSWSNTLGSATIFGGGSPVATSLQTSAALADEHPTDFLYYLDAPGLPATSRSDALSGDDSFSAISELSVDESQDNGMPIASGSIGFEATDGAGAGSGSGAITLYFLISVPDPAVIELSNIRSTLAATGSSSSAFSLDLFPSDASGAKLGSTLLSFSGNYFDAGGSYQTSAPYYLLEMNVSAGAAPGASASVEFSYRLDLQPTPVPEPSSTALLLATVLAGSVLGKARQRRTAA